MKSSLPADMPAYRQAGMTRTSMVGDDYQTPAGQAGARFSRESGQAHGR